MWICRVLSRFNLRVYRQPSFVCAGIKIIWIVRHIVNINKYNMYYTKNKLIKNDIYDSTAVYSVCNVCTSYELYRVKRAIFLCWVKKHYSNKKEKKANTYLYLAKWVNPFLTTHLAKKKKKNTKYNNFINIKYVCNLMILRVKTWEFQFGNKRLHR